MNKKNIKKGFIVTTMGIVSVIGSTATCFAAEDDNSHFYGKDEGITAPIPEGIKPLPDIVFPPLPEKPVRPSLPSKKEDTNLDSEKTFVGKDEGVTAPTPEVPSTPDVEEPEIPELPEKPEKPVKPDVPTTPDVEEPVKPTPPEKPVIPPEVSENPGIYDEGDNDNNFEGKDEGVTNPTPEVPSTPDVEEPEIPELPEKPEKPAVPDIPVIPELPTEPIVPEVPSIPNEVIIPDTENVVASTDDVAKYEIIPTATSEEKSKENTIKSVLLASPIAILIGYAIFERKRKAKIN